jgi:FkbM family methyltransferase
MAGSIDRHIVAEGAFEKGVIELLQDLIPQLGTQKAMFDIGANIGNHTAFLAPIFDQVVCYEPHPAIYHVLNANVAANKLEHVTTNNFGLGSEDTSAVLQESTIEHGLSKVKGRSQLDDSVFGFDQNSPKKEFEIEIREAGEELAQYAEVLSEAFFKIDVEGMEAEILRALGDTITAHRPVVAFEWFAKEQIDIVDFVNGLEGYKLYGIVSRDTGRSLLARSFGLLTKGRFYDFLEVDMNALDDIYTLAILVPEERTKTL